MLTNCNCVVDSKDMPRVGLKKYRYDFSKEFLVRLDMFSKDHINDVRKVFNSAWLEWQDMHSLLISAEIERIVLLGYEGDVIAKMYHHARFSLRKKLVKLEKEKGNSGEKDNSGEKGKINKKEMMKMIVCHIEYFIQMGFVFDHSPSEAFEDFYNNCDLVAFDVLDALKKAYKNKYYVLVRSKK